MTPEPDHFTPEAVDEQLDQVAQQLREQDPALAESPTLHVVAHLQRLYDQQARAEGDAWQQVRQRLLRTSAAARYLQQSQAQPSGTPSVQQPERTLEGQHGVAPAQRPPQQKGPRTGLGIRQESGDPLLHLVRDSQRWSARGLTLVAIGLLVVLVGGLTLGLILTHRADMGTLTPAGTVQEFALPTSCGANGCIPEGITRGPDGNVWFTEAGGNRIGRITPTGHITEFPLPTSCSGTCLPTAITSGPDGNLWFTETDGNQIGRITPSGRITEFPIPISTTKQGPPGINDSNPIGITSGPDGNLWFTEQAGNRIGRITPAGHLTEFPLPTTCNDIMTSCNPSGITSGPDGNLWFTETGINPDTGARQFGRITPAGTIQEFAVPLTCRNGCDPAAITSGPDGNLWFTDNEANEIGRITPAGHLTEFPLPTTSCTLQHPCGPAGITSGPDGNLWFTEEFGNQIGRISP